MMQVLVVVLLVAIGALLPSLAQAFVLSFDQEDFTLSPEFSDVHVFNFRIEVAGSLRTGAFVDPELVSIDYGVNGTLAAGTPSQFPAFDLMRTMTGEEFYAQGSSLSFRIAEAADLSDGLQVDELVGDDVVFTFNGREVDNGRFHPALVELNADGGGRIQNSNNVPTLMPRLDVAFAAEYSTALSFDAGNLTLAPAEAGSGSDDVISSPLSSGGGGAVSLLEVLILAVVLLCWPLYRRRQAIHLGGR